MATVSDIMNPTLLYIRDGDRLTLARSKIIAFGVTAVPILDEDHKPVGVVSLRDLQGSDTDVQGTRPARVVEGSVSVEEGARMLAEAGVHHLVVVDAKGVAIGMVSSVDFVRAFVGLPPLHPEKFRH